MDSHVPFFRDFEFSRAMPDGVTRYFSLTGEPRLHCRRTFLGYRGVGRDITETALMRERIEELAYSDPLHRASPTVPASPGVGASHRAARRHGARIAGRSIDLTALSRSNDTYGHDAGDQFLVGVARRLAPSCGRPTSSRGSAATKFFVVLEEVTDAAPLRASRQTAG